MTTSTDIISVRRAANRDAYLPFNLIGCGWARWFFFFLISAFSLPLSALPHNPLDYVLSRDITVSTRAFDPLPVDVMAMFFPYGNERVRVDLSLDGGATWPINIANGIRLNPGDNIIPWHIRITPDRWTETAQISVRDLWAETSDTLSLYTSSHSGIFTIAGLRIISPAEGTTVSVPTYLPIQFQESGAESVRIGTSTNGINFTETVTLLTPGAGIIYYTLPLLPNPTGPLWIAISDTNNTNMTDVVKLNITEP